MSIILKNLSNQIIHMQKRKKHTHLCVPSLGKAIVAVGQMRSTNNKESNLCLVEELITRAKEKHAKMLFLPECCDFLVESHQQTFELAEPLSGPLMTKYSELAKSNQIWLSVGIQEQKLDGSGSDGKTKIHNSHVLFNDDGKMVSIYRKLHLFDGKAKNLQITETNTVSPGVSLLPPVATPVGRIGLQICYDLCFPETGLLLRKMGAQILTYAGAFPYSLGKGYWELLLRARAAENQCFVVASNQQGTHHPKYKSWGHAMIIDPSGVVLADCGTEELAVGVAEIDLSVIDKVTTSIPCFQHRRNDIYSLTAYNIAQAEEFCKDRFFANNKIDKRTIFYETEHCFAFTNLCCVVEGHVLVSTKRITQRLNGLNCAEMSDLFTTVCFIQRMLEDIYKTSSATVTVQDGKEAGQTVPHVHFHVMPRRSGDFGHIEQMYVKLEDRVQNTRQRTLQERIDEAEMYRKFLRNSQY